MVVLPVLLGLTLVDVPLAIARPPSAPAAEVAILDQPVWSFDVGVGDSRFGRSVAAAGRDVLVAGSNDDGAHGRAILFDARTGRVRLDISPEGCCDTGGLFGLAVAASRHGLAVAAPYGPGIHLFARRTGAWLWTLAGNGGGILFGRSLAWDGDRLVAGAPWQGHTGAAFVVEPWTGLVVQALQPPAGASNADTFGTTVAAANARIAVGAPGAVGLDPGPGAVFVYGADGHLEATLASPASDAGDLFGAALAARSDRILVGTPRGHAAPPADEAADLFERRGGGWMHVRRFQVPDAPNLPSFGAAVAMDARRVVVGAPQVQAVFVFDLRTGATLAIAQPPPPEDPDAFSTVSRFGESVALVGRMLVVGAPGDDEDESGQVFAYRLDGRRPVR